MPEVFERLTQLAEHAIGSLKVSNALTSCLWLCALALPTGLLTAALSSGPVQTVALTIACAPILFFGIGFLYFMVKSPEKLRSEEYELRKIALELVEEKGSSIAIAETSVEALFNTDYKPMLKLSHKGDEE